MKHLLSLALVAMLLPLATAIECPDVPYQGFPGYMVRFSGSVAVESSAQAEEFSIEVTSAGTSYAYLDIYRHGEPYTSGTVTGKKEFVSPGRDIIVKLQNLTAGEPYLTVYTPKRANLSAKMKIAPEKDYSQLVGSQYPSPRANTELRVELTLTNTGELKAENISLRHRSKDFEVISGEGQSISYLCPDSSSELLYRLRAPNIYETYNYTLIFEAIYSDFNQQLDIAKERSQFFKNLTTVVGESKIEVEKSIVYPWDAEKVEYRTPAELGDAVFISNRIANKGEIFDFRGTIRDVLPEGLLLLSGNNEFSGKIPPNSSTYMTYSATSHTPMSYETYSEINYTDAYGNLRATAKSKVRKIEFKAPEPEIEIEKLIQETGREISRGDRVNMHANESINVTVVLKNTGERTALDLEASESTPLRLSGEPDLKLPSLSPGERASYSFTLTAVTQGKKELTTRLRYKDSSDVVYTKKHRSYLYVDAPSISIDIGFRGVSEKENQKKIKIELRNTGSKTARNLLVSSDFPSEVKLIKYETVKLTELEDGSSSSFEYVVELPELEEEKKLFFTVEAEYEDERGIKYRDTFSQSLLRAPEITDFPITVSGTSKLEVGEISLVKIKVRNRGDTSGRVKVEVEVPPALHYNESYGRKDREIFLKPSESFEYSFAVKALKPGKHDLRIISVEPQQVERGFRIKVLGPSIVAQREVEKNISMGKNLSLTVNLRNIGGRVAREVRLVQGIPESFSLMEGAEEFYPGNISVGEKWSPKLILVPQREGDFELEPLYVEWRDARGNEYSLTGSRETLHVVAISREREEELNVSEKPEAQVNISMPNISVDNKSIPPEEGINIDTVKKVLVGLAVYIAVIVLVIKVVFRR